MADPRALHEEGLRHYQAGRYDEAAACFAAACDLFTAGGDVLAAAEVRSDLGVVYHAQRRWDEAATAFTAALQDFEQLDISARISMTGVAGAATGDYQANLVTLDTKTVTAIALHLDQRVP